MSFDSGLAPAGFRDGSEGFALKIIGGLGALILSAGGVADARAAAPERSISITPSVRLTYDSNVLGGRGVVRSNVSGDDDVRLSPSMGADILYPLGRQSAFLAGSIGYDFYRRHSELNRERINLDGGLHLQGPLGCAGTLAAGYSRRQSDIGDLILAPDGTTLVNIVNVQENRRYSAKMSCGAAIGIRPGVGYTRSETRNSGSRSAQDIVSDTFTASLGYTRPSFGLLSIYGSYRNGRYPNRQEIPGVLFNDGIEVYSAGASYDRDIGSRLGGAVSVGYTQVEPKSSLVPKFHGLSYSAALRFQPSSRLNTNLSASRSAEQSNVLAVSYTISTAYAFSGSYSLSQRMSAPFSLGYSTRRFRATSFLPGALVRGTDKTYDASLGLRFKPRPKLNMGVDATYRKRTSDVGLLGYSSKQISAIMGLEL